MFGQFFIAVLLYTNVVLALPVKRSIDLDNPCYVLAEETPSPSDAVPLGESMTELIARSEGLKLEAKNIQAYLINHQQLDNSTVKQLNEHNWMDDGEFNGNMEQVQASVEQKYDALITHYHLIAEHLLYINQARTVGKIAEVSSEADTRQKLEEYEAELKSSMCSVKIALLSSGNDVTSTVSEDVLDFTFKRLAYPLENATMRAYIALQDGLELMEYLNVIYKAIQLSLDDTEA